MNGADIASARSHIYGLLSLVYRQEPTEELLRQLGQPEIQAVFNENEKDMGLQKTGDDLHILIKELSVEYTHLFVVPEKSGGVSPYESVYHNGGGGGLWGEEAVDVKRFVESLGLSLDRTTLLPDHVALECELLQKLAAREGEAWQSGDVVLAKELARAQHLFLERHLGRWFPLFAQKVEEKARHPFYRELTRLARQFIEQDLKETLPCCGR